jgi:hypothetical protein
MNDYIETDFKFDYSKLESLPDQFARNLSTLNKWKKDIESLKKIQEQIRDLEYSLESGTHYLATKVIEQNVFPRFNGYNDFVQGETYPSDKKGYMSFFTAASAMEHMNPDETADNLDIVSCFRHYLETFIWLFFKGGDVIKTNHVVDYIGMGTVPGSYSSKFPPSVEYLFFVTNADTGKAYKVNFLFYDIERGLHLEEMNDDMFNADEYGMYSNIRKVRYGEITVTVAEITNGGKSSMVDERTGDKHFIKSFDPIEIAAFIDKTVTEGI